MEVLGMPIGKCPSSCELWNFRVLPLNSMTHSSHSKATRSLTQPQHRNIRWPYNIRSETFHPNLNKPIISNMDDINYWGQGHTHPNPNLKSSNKIEVNLNSPYGLNTRFCIEVKRGLSNQPQSYWNFEGGLKLGWECLWPQYSLSSYWDIGLIRLGIETGGGNVFDLNLCYHPILTHWGWGWA